MPGDYKMIIIDHAHNEVFFVQKTFTVHLVGDTLLHTFAPDAEIKGGGGVLDLTRSVM